MAPEALNDKISNEKTDVVNLYYCCELFIVLSSIMCVRVRVRVCVSEA